MKLFFYLFSFILFSQIGIAQNIPQNPNKMDKKGLRQGKWTICYNEDWSIVSDCKSATYYRLLTYKNDKPIGKVRDYFLSGKVQMEANLTADRPQEIFEGKAIWYYENGKIATEVEFVNGLKKGREKSYYPNGVILSINHYVQGQKQGKEIKYDESGKPNNINYYEKDSLVALQTIWDNAVAAYEASNYVSADTLFQDIYVMFQNRFGSEHINCAQALSYLWNTQNFLEKQSLAEGNLEEMLRVRDLQKIPKDSLLRDWLYNAIIFYQKSEKYASIEKHLIRLTEVQKELTGENSEQYLTYRRNLGEYFRYQKRYKEGQRVFEENIAFIKKQFPQQPEKYSADLSSLAYLYEEEQQYDKADQLYLEAALNYQSKGDTTEKYANTLKNLISLYQSQDKNTEAIPWAKIMCELQARRKSKMSNEYALALLDLQQSFRELQQFGLAEPILQERLQINRQLYSEKSYEYASALYDLALLRDEESKYEEAKNYDLQAIQAMNSVIVSPKDQETFNERFAELWAHLGDVYAHSKDVISAEKAFLTTSEYLALLKNKNTFTVATIYERIGTAQARIDNYKEAEDAYQEAINITAITHGTTHHNYIQAVANLATLYSFNQQAPKAIEILDELMKKMVQENKIETLTYTQLLNSKALAYKALAQDSAVIATYQAILATYKKVYGENSPNYLNQFANLIQNQIAGEHLAEAEANLKHLEKLATQNQIKSIDKFYYNTILVLKGYLANAKKDYPQAIEFAKEENAIGRFLGKPREGLVSLALNYFMNRQAKEGAASYKTYIDFVMKDVRQVFPYLSDNQKVSFYSSQIQYHLDLYYYMALAEPLKLYFGETDSVKLKANKIERNKTTYIKHPNNADIFDYQLITKGILFESSQRMRQAILSSGDSDLIRKFNEWQAKKEEMNKIFQTPDSKQKEEMKAKINLEILGIEKQLAIKSSLFTQKNNSRDYAWQDVQKKLKKGEALVEILVINAGQKLNPAKNQYSDMYLAFVITPDTKDYPLCVRIGEGDSLERKYANYYHNSIKARKADKYSYNQYWKKLADTLKSYKKVYFAPDGIYHKVNINTLQNPETGKYVIEEKEIQFISQSRDFITQKSPTYKMPTSLTLFGAPNYNNLPTSDTPQKKASSNALDRSVLTILLRDTTQRFFQGNQITELKGTEIEVNNLEKIAQKAKIRIQKYLGNEANEEVLKEMTMPSVLHIATHGFFIPEQSANASTQGIDNQRDGFAKFDSEALKNPLRRSGLLFAYCSQAFSDTQNKIKLNEDGILTAEEAQNLALEQTEMVVLSACETGLGKVKNGEGVYGLQRAFQTAGAKSVLMSLWTVSDEATQELMTLFYENWITKQIPKRQAFIEAQRQLRVKFPEPYYWGAFVMVGE
jgi:CHAT domain-containing protein/tetratricopeptide (TPR) repeat protein